MAIGCRVLLLHQGCSVWSSWSCPYGWIPFRSRSSEQRKFKLLSWDLPYKVYVNIPLLIGTLEQDDRTHFTLRRILSLQYDSFVLTWTLYHVRGCVRIYLPSYIPVFRSLEFIRVLALRSRVHGRLNLLPPLTYRRNASFRCEGNDVRPDLCNAVAYVCPDIFCQYRDVHTTASVPAIIVRDECRVHFHSP